MNLIGQMRFQKCIDSILIGSACSFKFVDGLIILESDWARIFLVINPELDYSQTCNFWVLFSFWSISRHFCDFVKKCKNMFFGNFLAIFGLLPKCAFFLSKNWALSLLIPNEPQTSCTLFEKKLNDRILYKYNMGGRDRQNDPVVL